ncbi:MAG: hypothetical protein NT077_02615 [Candidatus Taylorbacteria bacterium]|nr:hypothetical protein [Candidatus Taylorbacteria bacterium]
MKARSIQQGLPFIAHGGMWGDLLIITPLMGVIVSTYGGGWTLPQVLSCVALGMIVSVAMHLSYLQGTFPESHIDQRIINEADGRRVQDTLSGAGRIHVVYMAAMLAIIFLFYFASKSVSVPDAINAQLLLSVHIIMGTHIPLGLWNPKWYGRRPDLTAYVTVTVVAVFIAWRTFAIIEESTYLP